MLICYAEQSFVLAFVRIPPPRSSGTATFWGPSGPAISK